MKKIILLVFLFCLFSTTAYAQSSGPSTGVGGDVDVDVDSVFGRTGVVTPQSGDYDTDEITEVTDKKFVTDAYITLLSNTTGENSGDNADNSQYSSKTGRTATYTVATSDSTDEARAQADYVGDGTADDVEIQAAIDAANGGKVFIFNGTYDQTAQIDIEDNNTTLEGEGYLTALVANSSLAAGAINHQIHISGSFCTVKNLALDGSVNKVNYQITIMDNRYTRVEGCKIGSSRTDGIVFGDNTEYGVATNNYLYNHYGPDNTDNGGTVDDHTSSLEIEDGGRNIIMSNNIVYNSRTGFFPHDHAGENNSRNITFSNNILIKGPDSAELSGCGIYLNTVLFENNALSGLTITGNIIQGGRLQTSGWIEATISGNIFDNSTSLVSPAILIADNATVILDNNIVRHSGQRGISVYAPNTVVSNNTIFGSTNDGVFLSTGADYSLVAGNNIYGNDDGVVVDPANNVSIKDNNIKGDFESQTWGVRVKANSVGNIIKGNDFYGNITGQIWNLGIDTIISNNDIDNSMLTSGWSIYGGSIYTFGHTVQMTADSSLKYNGVEGTYKDCTSASPTFTTEGDWCWRDNNNVYFYGDGTDPDTAYTDPGIVINDKRGITDTGTNTTINNNTNYYPTDNANLDWTVTKTITDNETLSVSSDYRIFCDTTSNVIAVTAPLGATVIRGQYHLFNTTASNDVIFYPTSPETVDGGASKSLSEGVLVLTFDGVSDWR